MLLTATARELLLLAGPDGELPVRLLDGVAVAGVTTTMKLSLAHGCCLTRGFRRLRWALPLKTLITQCRDPCRGAKRCQLGESVVNPTWQVGRSEQKALRAGRSS